MARKTNKDFLSFIKIDAFKRCMKCFPFKKKIAMLTYGGG